MLKKIQQIIKAPAPHWVGNGFFVNGFFQEFLPINSPFLLFDYAKSKYFGPSSIERGVGSHPHRGFETVTIALRGKIEHRDSNGNVGIIGAGDVQWMTAGSGILHQEFFETEFNKTGGDFQMVQLWVNLPRKHKMTTPKYQAINSKDIPVVYKENNKISIIAGKFDDKKGVASTFSPINLFILEIENELTFEISDTHTTMILVLEGSLEINNSLVKSDHLVVFQKEGQGINLVNKSNSKTTLLVLSGEPINEPIAHYGPFVMNTKQEIVEAINDFNSGKFGNM